MSRAEVYRGHVFKINQVNRVLVKRVFTNMELMGVLWWASLGVSEHRRVSARISPAHLWLQFWRDFFRVRDGIKKMGVRKHVRHSKQEQMDGIASRVVRGVGAAEGMG